VFTRIGVAEEEITPPTANVNTWRPRPFDGDHFSAAQILAGAAFQGALQSSGEPSTAVAGSAPPSIDRTSSIVDAAAVLREVRASSPGAALVGGSEGFGRWEDDDAESDDDGQMRARYSKKRSRSMMESRARSRLKMHDETADDEMASAGVGANAGDEMHHAARLVNGGRPASRQQNARGRKPKRRRVKPSSLRHDTMLRMVGGIDRPITILSDATLLQLELLSCAFHLCPHPTADQIAAISHHVAVGPDKLHAWFESRRTLQEWVLQPPQPQPADIAILFYMNGSERSTVQ